MGGLLYNKHGSFIFESINLMTLANKCRLKEDAMEMTSNQGVHHLQLSVIFRK